MFSRSHKTSHGAFHLFFGLQGFVCQHTDSNAVITFIFSISMEACTKGDLEIGGSP